MPHQLSFGRVLRRDWPSFGLSVFLSFVWGFAITGYVVAAIWYPLDAEGWVLVRLLGLSALGITVLCGTVIVWRIHRIRQVFARGEVVRGQVRSIGENSEQIAYAVIAYEYLGREYVVNNVTEGVGGRRQFTPNEAVDIVVDPSKPSRAFIAKLFLE